MSETRYNETAREYFKKDTGLEPIDVQAMGERVFDIMEGYTDQQLQTVTKELEEVQSLLDDTYSDFKLMYH